MKLQNNRIVLALIFLVSITSASYAKQERSQEAKDAFKYSHPG